MHHAAAYPLASQEAAKYERYLPLTLTTLPVPMSSGSVLDVEDTSQELKLKIQVVTLPYPEPPVSATHPRRTHTELTSAPSHTSTCALVLVTTPIARPYLSALPNTNAHELSCEVRTGWSSAPRAQPHAHVTRRVCS